MCARLCLQRPLSSAEAFLSLISQALAPVSYFQHDLINELIKTERERVDINNVSVVRMHCRSQNKSLPVGLGPPHAVGGLPPPPPPASRGEERREVEQRGGRGGARRGKMK